MSKTKKPEIILHGLPPMLKKQVGKLFGFGIAKHVKQVDSVKPKKRKKRVKDARD